MTKSKKKALKESISQFLQNLFLLFLLGAGILYLEENLFSGLSSHDLTVDIFRSEEFRSMRLSSENLAMIRECSVSMGISFGELAAVLMLEHDFELQDIRITEEMLKSVPKELQLWKHYNMEEIETMAGIYEHLFGEIGTFPVSCPLQSLYYEDSWMMARTYGGERSHEGCDIFPEENIRGKYPIVAAQGGVIEKMGWLPLGGWRIGIRTSTGAYHYYAHLESYAEGIAEGDTVTQGEFLGFMGDSGYGEEGTKGKFDVHLHFGIYLDVEGEEISFNPYWILKQIELERNII